MTGTWQGTSLPNGKELRTVIKVLKADGGAMRGTMFSIDQGAGPGIPVNPVTLQGTTVKMAMPGIGGTYEGKLECRGTDHRQLEAGTRAAGLEPEARHRRNRLGHSRPAAAAETDGRRCEAGV